MRGESRESEPPRQGPGNTRLELAETTTPAVRCPGLPTPTRCKAALADTSQGSSQPRGGQVSSAAPRPSASPRSGSCAGAKGAQVGERDTAAAGLQPPPPSEGRRPSSGKETSYIKAAGPLPSGDALCRAHLTGPAPRPPAPGTRDDPAAAARWAQGPSRPPATRPRAAPQCRPRSPAPPCAARLALAPNPELT
ncbi:atherin-like [Ursus americanus]|uniref:atherin-like n=1 Tax=Ursus americanus TaxID=9643 RepID=UPI001E67D324|nr:atherin-like [Ursus americanus]